MSNSNGTAHLYGRYQTPEPLAALASLHVHDGTTPLREIVHTTPLDVLDQEDLLKQGIRVSTFIHGARNVDALGSCTANAYTAALAEACLRACNGDAVAALALFQKLTAVYGLPGLSSWEDVVAAERMAIAFYHGCTMQTGQPTQEFPPSDPGSSGPYVVEYGEKLKQIAGQKTAHGTQNLVSLLQTGGVMIGSPFFNSFEEPNAAGFVDGNGTPSDIQAALYSGLAGGHETFILGPEKLVLTATGAVDAEKSHAIVRNSWTKSWGDAGCYRIHFSTLAALGGQCDYRQLTPVAA